MSFSVRFLWGVSVVFAIGCDRAPTPSASPSTNPALLKLLDMKDADKTLLFVKQLEEIAKEQRWHREFTEWKKEAVFGRADESTFYDAHAVSVRSAENHHVAVLLTSGDRMIPGSDLQTVILLAKQGDLLDRLGCTINSRVGRYSGGKLHTEVPTETQADGAQLIVRLDGVSARGNFSHQIEHNGAAKSFSWRDYDSSPNRATRIFSWGEHTLFPEPPTRWDTKGLCRVAISDNKLDVVFPTERDQLEKPNNR